MDSRSPLNRDAAKVRAFNDRGRRPLKRTGGWRRSPIKKKRHRPWKVGQAKVAAEGICRVCRMTPATDPHHIVYRSLAGSNELVNCLPVCRPCHDAIHRHEIDVWDYLRADERAAAVAFMGRTKAFELLIPSTSAKRVERRAA